MLYVNETSTLSPEENTYISLGDTKKLIYKTLSLIGKRKSVLAIPPDISRYPSHGGVITQYLWEFYKKNLSCILPATGLHAGMTRMEMKRMFGEVPEELFRNHDPESGLASLGRIPGDVMANLTQDLWNSDWPCEVNQVVSSDKYDLIMSIGQVVPHEVAGMSNYNKNLYVGIGGSQGIGITHYISAVYGIEKTLGRVDTPVRRIFNYASEHFLKQKEIVYILTVIGSVDGNPCIKGLFIGNDAECFLKAAQYSQKINIKNIGSPVNKIIVYLPPEEYKSTWLGNKAIYRTRMALKKDGELIILGPGISGFGETSGIDAVIRKFGYAGTGKIREIVEEKGELYNNLAIAAHLIHGSTDGRFSVSLCPGKLEKYEVERVNFGYGDLSSMLKLYNPSKLNPGYNLLKGGEEIYFIRNPGLGLWVSNGQN